MAKERAARTPVRTPVATAGALKNWGVDYASNTANNLAAAPLKSRNFAQKEPAEKRAKKKPSTT